VPYPIEKARLAELDEQAGAVGAADPWLDAVQVFGRDLHCAFGDDYLRPHFKGEADAPTRH